MKYPPEASASNCPPSGEKTNDMNSCSVGPKLRTRSPLTALDEAGGSLGLAAATFPSSLASSDGGAAVPVGAEPVPAASPPAFRFSRVLRNAHALLVQLG